MRRNISETAVIISLLALALAGCSTSGGVTTGADDKAASPKAKTTAARVGQSITISGNTGTKIAVVALKVVDPVQATDGFTKPTAGMRFVAVQFRITNVGKVAYDDSPSNGAKVVDGQGQQFQSELVVSISAGPLLPASTKLPAAGSALGFIAFQLPIASKVAKVQFGADSGFGQTGEWTV